MGCGQSSPQSFNAVTAEDAAFSCGEHDLLPEASDDPLTPDADIRIESNDMPHSPYYHNNDAPQFGIIPHIQVEEDPRGSEYSSKKSSIIEKRHSTKSPSDSRDYFPPRDVSERSQDPSLCLRSSWHSTSPSVSISRLTAVESKRLSKQTELEQLIDSTLATIRDKTELVVE